MLCHFEWTHRTLSSDMEHNKTDTTKIRYCTFYFQIECHDSQVVSFSLGSGLQRGYGTTNEKAFLNVDDPKEVSARPRLTPDLRNVTFGLPAKTGWARLMRPRTHEGIP